MKKRFTKILSLLLAVLLMLTCFAFAISAEDCEHEYAAVENTGRPATCTTKGFEAQQKCSKCGVVTEQAEIPALGHDYEDMSTTIADDGTYMYTFKKCKNCGDIYAEVTFIILASTRKSLPGASIKITTDSGVVVADGQTDANGMFKAPCKFRNGTNYKVEIVKVVGAAQEIGSGTLKVYNNKIVGTFCKGGVLTSTANCTCNCHEGGIIGIIKRYVYTVASAFSNSRVTCCKDMEYYGPLAKYTKK